MNRLTSPNSEIDDDGTAAGSRGCNAGGSGGHFANRRPAANRGFHLRLGEFVKRNRPCATYRIWAVGRVARLLSTGPPCGICTRTA